MNNVAVANIDVAQMMSCEDNQNALEQMKSALDANPALSHMVYAAQSIEEMYESLKEYMSLKLEDFKVVFAKAFAYIVPPKTRLDDDTMDCVAGGGYLHDWKDLQVNIKKAVICAAILAGLLIVGTATGAAIGSKLC